MDSDSEQTPRDPALNSADAPHRVSRREFVGGFAAAMGYASEEPELDLFALLRAHSRGNQTTGPVKQWYELPDVFAMVYLVFLRDWLRNSNLYDTEEPPLPRRTGDVPQAVLHARTIDGTWNDLDYPTMGAVGRRLGRNVPLNVTFPDPAMLDPNPRVISQVLMRRQRFEAAESINILAAAWIQFQVHDWFAHKDGSINNVHEVPLPAGDPWPHGNPMKIPKTPPSSAPHNSTRPPAYANRVPHWWDGSQLYGRTAAENDWVRVKRDGKLKVHSTGLLEFDSGKKEEITGFMPNGWMGVSMLHGVFALEHNAVCDHLKKKHPQWSDDQLYHKARLVVAALMAKIHTLEWTPAALQTKLMNTAMRTNWHGLLGSLQSLSKAFENDEIVGGIIGSPTDHHTAPYSLTEEFVTVYRMHPLMPDEFVICRAGDGVELETLTLENVIGLKGRTVLERYEYQIADIFYSFGIAHPGVIGLRNYPRHLQDFELPDRRRIDLATVEIVRDRERGIPRYNAFRRLLGKRPIMKFCELTADGTLAADLEAVYGDVDKLDTVVGLLAETRPAGFAFSETAFRIFILMASRRLKSDRFYTSYWNKATYTKEGIEWVEENSMATILRRHFRELKRRIDDDSNAFMPWESV